MTRQIRLFVAICAFASGVLYLAEMAARYDTHPTLGRLYLMLAVLQVTWGALLLTQPSRLVYALGAVLTAVLVLAWVLTRTHGISWFPGLHEVQPLGWRDVVIQFFQLFAIAGAVILLLPATRARAGARRRRAHAGRDPRGHRAAHGRHRLRRHPRRHHEPDHRHGRRTTTVVTTTTTTIAPTTTTTAPGS